MAVHTLPRYTRRTVFPSVRHTGSPWPGLRAPWKGKQGGHREGTQRARLPLGTGGGTSFGSFEHPGECITHSNAFKRIQTRMLCCN